VDTWPAPNCAAFTLDITLPPPHLHRYRGWWCLVQLYGSCWRYVGTLYEHQYLRKYWPGTPGLQR
jgi:hypothetical protein